MARLIPLLFLVTLPVFAQSGEKADPSVPFAADIEFGAGWDQLFNGDFNAFLSANSLTQIDPLRTWLTDWRWSFGFNSVYMSVGSSRMSNYVFGAYGDAGRAKLVWDSTRMNVGFLPVRLPGFEWSLGAGVAVSKFSLQAYQTGGGTFAAVFGGGGNIGLVSSWNWSPEAETTFAVRLFPIDSQTAIWLRLGAQGGWLPLPAVWSLYDDPEVTGVPNPFTFYVRYAIWIGMQVQ